MAHPNSSSFHISVSFTEGFLKQRNRIFDDYNRSQPISFSEERKYRKNLRINS